MTSNHKGDNHIVPTEIEGVAIHPAAEMFPMLDGDAFEELKADIKANGQRVAITYWGGKLLDGRNRYRACIELGIEPEEEELDEELVPDPVAWVISTNLHRRHLTDQQRAGIAAKIAKLRRGDVGNGRKVEPQYCGPTAVPDVAAMFNVSPRKVEQAKRVQRDGSKTVVEKVDQDEIPLSVAEKLVKHVPNKSQQSKLAKAGVKAINDHIAQLTADADVEVYEDVDDEPQSSPSQSDHRMNDLRDTVDGMTESELVIVRDWIDVRLGSVR